MGNSSSLVARSVRFALVVLVCLVFGLALGYSATPALKWLGKRIAAAETSRPASFDSYASRRTEPVISAKADSDSPFERLPLVPLVGKIVQKSDSYAIALDEGHPLLSSVRNGTHWEYCGNPQCRLCYPVAGSFASDLPDMPQGYCKRHPQSRDCKPIVVPAPKPLPKATDPPVIASAGLGVVSRETLAWVLVCVFFVAWLVSGFEIHRLRRRQTVSDFRDTVETAGLARVRRLVQDWLDKQGHDRCWYYPEIFEQLARALDLQHIVLKPPQLPSLSEYKAGCERYQREQLLAAGVTPKIPEAVMRDMPVWSEEIKRKHLSVIRPLSVSKGHIPEAARCNPGDLCSLHKPCAKHGPIESAQRIIDEQGDSESPYVGVIKTDGAYINRLSEIKLNIGFDKPTNSDVRGTDKT